MDNTNQPKPPQDGSGLAVASITLGALSFMTLCVPWLMIVFALTGTVLGIVSWKKAKLTSTPPTLPIIGTVASGAATIVAIVIMGTVYLAMNSINDKWGEEFGKMDSMFNTMRDSMDIWNGQFDYDQLPEADSTFLID